MATKLINFTCKCPSCGHEYTVSVDTFTEWFNLPRAHHCELSA